MPFIRYNFRKKYRKLKKTSKMLILDPKKCCLPCFRNSNNYPLNTKTVTFTHFLMPFIKHKFREVSRTDFKKTLCKKSEKSNGPILRKQCY